MAKYVYDMSTNELGRGESQAGHPADCCGKPDRVIEDVACTFCGCVCDDLQVKVSDNRVVEAMRACSLGKAALLGAGPGDDAPVSRIGQKEVPLQDAVEEAAVILSRAKCPLIFGLSNTTTEAQREAVRLAELIGASIDSTSSICHGPGTLAMQFMGQPTASLGEVMNRADFVIFWGSNPAESHPRHMSRYSVTRPGLHLPNGKRDRTVLVVDVRRTLSARAADVFLQIEPNSDYRVLSNLLRMVKEAPLSENAPSHSAALAGTCSPSTEVLRDLARLMMTCCYGVLFYGVGLTMSRGGPMNVTAAIRLVRELNNHTRFSIIPMRGHGNVAGIDNVLAWRTGYPFSVNFSTGYPRFGPGEFSATDLLCRQEADAVLVVSADPVSNLPVKAAEHLLRAPLIAVDPHTTPTTELAQVVIPVAKAGISASGTYYRMDNVPIPVKELVKSAYPSDEEILREIVRRIVCIKQGKERST